MTDETNSHCTYLKPILTNKTLKMKSIKKVKDKKRTHKQKKSAIKPKKEQVLVVAQEIKFARLLSGNEKKTRDRVLKALKKWLSSCFEKSHVFKEDDFIRVWKGLFYAVWMSDKPLIQEELCESIAGILDLFPAEQIKYAVLMMKAGFRVLATEWFGIDHHRMDKFLMLVRRYLRGGLRCLHRCSWSPKSCEMFTKMLTNSDGILAVRTPHYARNATSMLMHVADCFLEECSKVSNGDIPDASMVILLRPFAEYMSFGESTVLTASCRRVLNTLIRQSELGLQYHQATRAWKQMGCPQGGPEALELVSDDEDDEETLSGDEDPGSDDGAEKPLDPRAGRVDVELASLPVPAAMISSMLKDMLAKASSKAHKRIKICMQRFEKLSQEEYPLPTEVPPADEEPAPKQKTSAKDLLRHERQMVEEADELALRGLSRKQRRRLLAKSRAGLSIVEDAKIATMGGWKVESTDTQSDSHDTNKESVSRNNKNKRKLSNGDINADAKKQKIKPERTDTANKDDKRKDKDVQKKENVKENSVATKVIEKKKFEKDTKKVDSTKLNGTNKDIKLANITNKNTNNVKVIKNNISRELNLNGIGDKKDSSVKVKAVDNSSVIVNKQTDNKKPSLVVNKIKNFQKQTVPNEKRTECQLKKITYHTPKKVKFVLKNNSMQGTMDYYKSVRQSPSIPFDGSRKPSKTNLKPSTPSPINPFFKKKLKLRKSM